VSAGSRPSVSLVLLTFNRWDRTARLLESIVDDADDYADVELVWVDNGSADGTRSGFETWLAAHEPMFHRVVRRFNDVNHGFIVGVNEGASLATGEHVCLINSDAVVTGGWRRGLLRALAGPGVAAAGPVSDGMPWNQSLDKRGRGIRPVPVVYGFCVLITRAALDTVGLLDERYGRGVIEVEDWCERATRAGLRFAVNTDVFVSHDEPHASYTPRVNGMLHIRNRGLFERKWGVGPWYWGDRDRAARSFDTTVARVAGDGVFDEAALRAELDTLDERTELLVVAPHRDDEEHLSWLHTARRDPRLNVVCVRPDWDERALEPLCAANARGAVTEVAR